MGRRSAGETIAAIYQLFLRQRTWRQAELAREVDISVEALRKRLDELGMAGMPLESEREDMQVFWSVPPDWYPGGVLLDGARAVDLVHELWRLPKTSTRTRLLRDVLAGIRAPDALAQAGASVLTPSVPDSEEMFLRAVEDALIRRTALRIKYHSAHSGQASTRDVSIQRVVPGPPARFVAVCHRSDKLKWFRVDGIWAAIDAADTTYREADSAHVNDFVAASADGFHEGDAASEHVFFVRAPESRWVEKNLFPPMKAEEAPGGIRVTALTAGVLRVARFVVSLGDAARPETEALRQAVLELAQGAARNATETSRPKTIAEGDVNRGAVKRIEGITLREGRDR